MTYAHFRRSVQGDLLIFQQIEKRRILSMSRDQVSSVPDGSGAIIAVGDFGVCMNGDTGNNPSREEMNELVAVMRECVAWYDEHFGKEKA